jgi:hypothetical protein
MLFKEKKGSARAEKNAVTVGSHLSIKSGNPLDNMSVIQ